MISALGTLGTGEDSATLAPGTHGTAEDLIGSAPVPLELARIQ